MNNFSALFSPLDLGPVTVRHRAFMSAHGMGLGYGHLGVSPEYHAYLVARARGGAALVGIESAPVHPTTVSRSLGIKLYEDAVVPSLAALAQTVHETEAKLAITLWHGGHKDPGKRARYTVAPSAVPNMMGEVPKVLTAEEINDIVTSYGVAAARCRRAGLDVLVVQTSTDYLLGSFLNPALNHREDAYGGSFENRLRIVAEVLETVREHAPDLAVGVRTSESHNIPGAPEDYDLDASVATMQTLASRGLIDFVDVMTGSAWAEGSSIPEMTTPRVQLANEGLRFKAALSVPVILGGMIRDPEDAERVIREERGDAVSMARTWICEPEWARKIEANAASQVRPCNSCNQGCVGMVFRGIPGTCTLNPSAGRELDLPAIESASKPHSVAVVGGGPAGMETARVLAERGHRVTLFEARNQLGGDYRLAAQAPHRNQMLPALAWWTGELARLGVDVRLNQTVSNKEPKTLGAETVVWAVGGRPGATMVWRLRPFLKDGIPGTEGLPHGRDVLNGTSTVAGSVLVIDEEGGWPTVSLLETLAARADVTSLTVATVESAVGARDLATTWEGPIVARRLEAANVRILPSTVIDSVENGTAFSAGQPVGSFDAIVLSTGVEAPTIPAGVIAVGDCVAPRGVWAATTDAARLARTI